MSTLHLMRYLVPAMLLCQSFTARSQTSCTYDAAELDESFTNFDQTEGKGWRALASKPGCLDAAANMIHQYRNGLNLRAPMLVWHEAQIKAKAGHYSDAILLMRQAKTTKNDVTGWNIYVDATVAFLEDRPKSFMLAKHKLEGLPKPTDWPTDSEWPENMKIVKAMSVCLQHKPKLSYGQCFP